MQTIVTVTMNPTIDTSTCVAHVAPERKRGSGVGVVVASGMQTELGSVSPPWSNRPRQAKPRSKRNWTGWGAAWWGWPLAWQQR